mgnify:CR=1
MVGLPAPLVRELPLELLRGKPKADAIGLPEFEEAAGIVYADDGNDEIRGGEFIAWSSCAVDVPLA